MQVSTKWELNFEAKKKIIINKITDEVEKQSKAMFGKSKDANQILLKKKQFINLCSVNAYDLNYNGKKIRKMLARTNT